MRKNLRLNALTRLAKVNEAVAVDIKKLKKNGINTDPFIKNVEMSNIPYTVNESYDILLLNDVVYSDVLESLRDLGVKRNLLSESVANGISKTGKSVNESAANRIVKRTVKKAIFEAYENVLNDCDGADCKPAKRRRSLKEEDVMDENVDLDINTKNIVRTQNATSQLKPMKMPVFMADDVINGCIVALGLTPQRDREVWMKSRGIKDIESLTSYLFNESRIKRFIRSKLNGWKGEDDRVTWVCNMAYFLYSEPNRKDELIANYLVKPILSELRSVLNGNNENAYPVKELSKQDMEHLRSLLERVIAKFYKDILDPESGYMTSNMKVIVKVLKKDIISANAKDSDSDYSWLYTANETNESARPFERKALPAMRTKGMSVNEASQLGEELLSKQELEKAQKQVDDIIEELKNEELDKRTAKKATTRLKKVKGLKQLKRVKHLINKLSKQYPDAKNLLTESVVSKVVNAIEGKRNYLNENMSINGNHISTYSLRELKECYSKVGKNVKALQSKIKEVSLNESYTAKDVRCLKEELKKQMALYYMLNEEISWKHVLLANGGFGNKPLNESDDEKDSKKEADDMGTSLDDLFNNIGDEIEDADKDSKDDEKKEDSDKKEDNDETAELDSVTITMSSKDAANGLKDALVEKGVPEDVIEVEEVETESDETNESVSYSKKFLRLFEDDEPDTDNDDVDTEESDEKDDDSNDTDKSDEDKQYNVTLTDTDYINTLKDVMVDEYGYNEDEFWDSIGGKPVDDEDDSDDDSEKDDKEDDEDKDDTSELDSIGADIFGDE